MENNQNVSALLLQNQPNINNVGTEQSAGIKSTNDPLKAAWEKFTTTLNDDFKNFAVPVSAEVKEATQAFSKIAKEDFGSFATVLGKSVKEQVNTLIADLTKEANAELKPQLQIFASKVEENLENTSKKMLSDVWDEAGPIALDAAKIVMNELKNGEKIEIADIAKEIMSSDHMKSLMDTLKKDLNQSVSAAINDAQDTLKQVMPAINGDIKETLVGFGAAVTLNTTVQAAKLAENLTVDIAKEVGVLHEKYGDINQTNVEVMAKDLLHDGGQVLVEVGKKIEQGAVDLANIAKAEVKKLEPVVEQEAKKIGQEVVELGKKAADEGKKLLNKIGGIFRKK